MNLTEYLHIRLHAGQKYSLEVIDGNSAPCLHHEDAYRTDYYTGRRTSYSKTYGGRKWNTYHAATNEMRVGLAWIQQHFPGWKENCDLSDEQISFAEWQEQAKSPTLATRSELWNADAAAETYRPRATLDQDLRTQIHMLTKIPSRRFDFVV